MRGPTPAEIEAGVEPDTRIRTKVATYIPDPDPMCLDRAEWLSLQPPEYRKRLARRRLATTFL